MQGIGFRFSHAVLVAFTLLFLLLASTPGRAGEGGEKTSSSPTKAKVSKPCFTLLNANQIPVDATPLARLNAARVDVHWNPKDGAPLRQVFTDLGRAIGVPVILMPEMDEVCLHDGDEVFLHEGTVQNISVRGYMDYLVYSISGHDPATKFCWEIRDGSVVVGNRMKSLRKIPARIRSLDKLEELPPAKKGVGNLGTWSFGDGFVELITSAIDPESWQEVGGSGTVTVIERSGAEVLVVRNYQEVQEQVAGLIDYLEQMLDSKEQNLERSLDEAATRCFSRAMQKKVTLDVEKMPLHDFIAELERQIGESILLDIGPLEAVGTSENMPITYRCKEKPLCFVVDDLRELESTWVSRFGVLELTTQEEAEVNLATSIYDVTDLAFVPEFSDFDMDSLIELITSVVDPCSWQSVGGPGSIDAICFMKRGRSFLIIRQTQSIRAKVSQFLAGLRAVRDKKLKRFPQLSKADRLLIEKLHKRLKWDVEEGTTLSDFWADLEKRLNIEVRVDECALESLGISQDHPMPGSPMHVDNVSAAGLLSLLLEMEELGWAVRHGELFITAEDELQFNLVTKLYEVSDLITCVDAEGEASYDFDSLIELIISTIDQESWPEVGGPAMISPYFYPDHECVIAINQTYQVHKEIDRFLGDLRATMPKDSAKRTLSVRNESLFRSSVSSGFGRGYARTSTKDEKKLLKKLPPLHPKQAELVKANNAFAMKLYRQMVRQQDGTDPQNKPGAGAQRVVRRKSFCFSPYSITALAQMIKVGTRYGTDSELQEALCLSLSADDLHRAYGSLLTSLMSEDASSILSSSNFSKRVPRQFDLRVANRLWIQEESNAQILPEFQKILEKRYLAGIEEVDFAGQSSESAKRINEWVSQQTKGRIDEIVSPDELDTTKFDVPTMFVAVNAVFFQGRWAKPFWETKTKPKPFYDSDGKTELGKVSMMSDSYGMYHVGVVDGVSVLSKPYYGDVSFFVLLPPPGEGELEKLEASFSSAKLRKWVTTPKMRTLEKVEMPRFKLESDFSLVDVMKQLGVKELFSESGADFFDMIPSNSAWAQDPLFIYLMRHKATIKVDEVGTVVAAVSGGMGGLGGGMIEPEVKEFIANRPFLFLVFDEKTSSLLFMGRYMGPE